MEKGLHSSKLRDAQSHTEDENDFVLQIDEADINNHENSDEDIKDEDLIKVKNGATGHFPDKSSSNDVKTSNSETVDPKQDSYLESCILKQKGVTNETDSSKLDRAHEDSRFSNHNRLEPKSPELIVNKDKSHKYYNNSIGTKNGMLRHTKSGVESSFNGNILEEKESKNSNHEKSTVIKVESDCITINDTKEEKTELLNVKHDVDIEDVDQELDSLLASDVAPKEKSILKENLMKMNNSKQNKNVDTNICMAIDSEDSLGISETDDSSVCSNASRNADQINKALKSNSDKENGIDSSASGSKGNKRPTEIEENELRTKKSKISDSEGEPIILNGSVNHKRVTNNEPFKEVNGSERKSNFPKPLKCENETMECDTTRLNGHITEDTFSNHEHSSAYLKKREQIIVNYMTANGRYDFDSGMLDELIMMKVVEYLAYVSEHGKHRERVRFLEKEQVRLNKLANSLKKQVEDAKHIIKKLIDEKVSNQPWTHNTQPLKVTRSVGLQVCTCGSLNMTTSKSKDRESVRQLLGLPPEKTIYEKKEVKFNIHNTNKAVVDNSDDLQIVGEDIVEEKPQISQQDSKATESSEGNNCKSTAAEQNGSTKNEARSNVIGSGPQKNNVILAKTPPPPITPTPPPTKTPTPPPGKTSESLPRRDPTSKIPDKLHKVVGAPLIDLTDNEDAPVSPSSDDSNYKRNTPSPSLSVKPPSALFPPEKVSSKDSSKLSPAQKISTNQNSFKTPHSTPTSRKSTTQLSKRPNHLSPVSAELVNSYEQLPKFPPSPKYSATVVKPPRPSLRIGKHNEGKQGIMLSWNFDSTYNPTNIDAYQLYAYQETKDKDSEKGKPETWKKVGDIKALPLPMACFLTQFVEGHKYHFIVRGVTFDKILGEFSLPGSIILQAAHQPDNVTADTSTK